MKKGSFGPFCRSHFLAILVLEILVCYRRPGLAFQRREGQGRCQAGTFSVFKSSHCLSSSCLKINLSIRPSVKFALSMSPSATDAEWCFWKLCRVHWQKIFVQLSLKEVLYRIVAVTWQFPRLRSNFHSFAAGGDWNPLSSPWHGKPMFCHCHLMEMHKVPGFQLTPMGCHQQIDS